MYAKAGKSGSFSSGTEDNGTSWGSSIISSSYTRTYASVFGGKSGKYSGSWGSSTASAHTYSSVLSGKSGKSGGGEAKDDKLSSGTSITSEDNVPSYSPTTNYPTYSPSEVEAIEEIPLVPIVSDDAVVTAMNSGISINVLENDDSVPPGKCQVLAILSH